MLADLPGAHWNVQTRILEGDVLFLEWTAEAGRVRAEHGVETFVVRDGEIVLQTVHYTVRRLDHAGSHRSSSATRSAVARPDAGGPTPAVKRLTMTPA